MENKEKKQKKRKGTVVRVILFLLFLGIMIYAGWRLYLVYFAYAEGKEAYDDLANQYATVLPSTPTPTSTPAAEGAPSAPPEESAEVAPVETAPIVISFESLLADCEDVVAWLYCADTPMNYPVVQSEDNDYYLRRLMNGRYNIAGTIFMDYRNQPDFSHWNTIIYGHNMNNGTMFGILPKYQAQSYYDAHPVFYLLTPEKSYKLELVAGYVTPSDSGAYTIPATVEERDALLAMAVEKSTFVSDVEVGPEDKLVTLSTCVYDYSNARYVLVGVLRELGGQQNEEE